MTVTKTGFGVSAGADTLVDAALDMLGVGVEDVVDMETLLVQLELEDVGFGAGSTTVVVTSCVVVGPGFRISTVLVAFTVVVTAGGACVGDPPSTLMTS